MPPESWVWWSHHLTRWSQNCLNSLTFQSKMTTTTFPRRKGSICNVYSFPQNSLPSMRRFALGEGKWSLCLLPPSGCSRFQTLSSNNRRRNSYNNNISGGTFHWKCFHTDSSRESLPTVMVTLCSSALLCTSQIIITKVCIVFYCTSVQRIKISRKFILFVSLLRTSAVSELEAKKVAQLGFQKWIQIHAVSFWLFANASIDNTL